MAVEVTQQVERRYFSAESLLDRLVHRCHILLLEGESFRFRQSLEHHEEQRLDQRQEQQTGAPATT